MKRRLAFVLVSAVSLLAACNANVPPPVPPLAPGGVRMNQDDTNDYSGGAGRGALSFGGMLYHFKISGLGVEGSALSLMQTTGDVTHLETIEQFPGVYRLASRGESGGAIWLRNERGVVLHLVVPPGSRMPLLENDGVQVRMDR
jgi:hypothetical protein